MCPGIKLVFSLFFILDCGIWNLIFTPVLAGMVYCLEYALGESGGSLQLAIMNAQIKWPVCPNPPYPQPLHQFVSLDAPPPACHQAKHWWYSHSCRWAHIKVHIIKPKHISCLSWTFVSFNWIFCVPSIDNFIRPVLLFLECVYCMVVRKQYFHSSYHVCIKNVSCISFLCFL